jgi:hypothetical protein
VGGFTGDIIKNVTLNNCRSHAGFIKIETNGNDACTVGGFAGVFRGNASGCYSKSPMEIIFNSSSAAQTENITIGGFAGGVSHGENWFGSTPDSGWTFDGCYATGSVDVYAASPAATNIKMGGFVGNMGTNSQKNGIFVIEDCYALGNITLDRSTAPSATEKIYTGGFAGFLKPESNGALTIRRCFSTGSVMAQAQTAYSELYVGGIAGYIDSAGTSSLSNCAALASFYTIQGGLSGSRGIGRICGNANGLSNNYACAARLEDGGYGSLNPGAASITSGINEKDGLTVAASTFNARSFWTSIEPNSGVWFNYYNSRWNFTGIGSRGYPLLADVGGQQ